MTDTLASPTDDKLAQHIISCAQRTGNVLPSVYSKLIKEAGCSREALLAKLSQLFSTGRLSFNQVADFRKQVQINRKLDSIVRDVAPQNLATTLHSLFAGTIDEVQIQAAIWKHQNNAPNAKFPASNSDKSLLGDSGNYECEIIDGWKRLCQEYSLMDIMCALEGGFLCGDLVLEFGIDGIQRHDMDTEYVWERMNSMQDTSPGIVHMRKTLPIERLQKLIKSHTFDVDALERHSHLYSRKDTDNVAITLFFGHAEMLDKN